MRDNIRLWIADKLICFGIFLEGLGTKLAFAKQDQEIGDYLAKWDAEYERALELDGDHDLEYIGAF